MSAMDALLKKKSEYDNALPYHIFVCFGNNFLSNFFYRLNFSGKLLKNALLYGKALAFCF
jgi:hypothetical protein